MTILNQKILKDSNSKYSIELFRHPNGDYTAFVSELALTFRGKNYAEAINGIERMEENALVELQNIGIIPPKNDFSNVFTKYAHNIFMYISPIIRFGLQYFIMLLLTGFVVMIFVPHVKIGVIQYLQGEKSKSDIGKIIDTFGYSLCKRVN